MKKGISLMISLLLTVGMLAGCGKAGTMTAGGNVRILVCISQMDTFMQEMTTQAEQTAAQMGITLEVVNAEQNIETQVSHIKKAVSEKYNAIICVPVDRDSALELETLAGDIPIVFFNSCPDEARLKAGQYMYVGSDENVAGQYQAEYILDKFADKSEINVAIFKGALSHPASKKRTEAVKKTLNASGKTIHYVFEDTASWSQQQATDLFQVFRKTNQPCDVVVCNNDDMALGVIDACKSAGLNDIMVLGIDATANGCAAIEQGDMAFTVYQSATEQGKSAVEAACILARKGDVSKLTNISDNHLYVWVPFEKVDASNVKNYK